jgi:hypothetical protein
MAGDYSIAVFPFLKTSLPVSLGGVNFYPTGDFDGMTPEQLDSITEITKILFLKDDQQIRSPTFAVIENVDIHAPQSEKMLLLRRIQDTVSYLYTVPHPILGRVFLSPEHASLAILIPENRVPVFALHAPHGVLPELVPPADFGDMFVKGYRGLYNFRNYFWVTKDSRLYGPMPQLTLNISQDLHHELERIDQEVPHLGVLLQLLNKPIGEFGLRIFSAIRWFNGSSRETIDHHEAILNLSTAFEALLALPQSEKNRSFGGFD